MKPERADFRPGKANWRSRRPDLRPVRADFRTEVANWRSRRGDWGPERADFTPEQVAQGQYVVSDTHCPAVSDCELE